MHLAVGGYNRDGSDSKTDLFDVSDFFKFGHKYANVQKLNQKLMQRVESMEGEIGEIKERLQKQGKHNNGILKQNSFN